MYNFFFMHNLLSFYIMFPHTSFKKKKLTKGSHWGDGGNRGSKEPEHPSQTYTKLFHTFVEKTIL